ncbi:MAG: hypothetical protein ACR2I0_05600, partial [Rhodoferax sp.]
VMRAAKGIAVQAGGSMSFGPNALSYGNPVSYSAGGLPYLAPWQVAAAGGGATDFVAGFMDRFTAVIFEQFQFDAQYALAERYLLAMQDPAYGWRAPDAGNASGAPPDAASGQPAGSTSSGGTFAPNRAAGQSRGDASGAGAERGGSGREDVVEAPVLLHRSLNRDGIVVEGAICAR